MKWSSSSSSSLNSTGAANSATSTNYLNSVVTQNGNIFRSNSNTNGNGDRRSIFYTDASDVDILKNYNIATNNNSGSKVRVRLVHFFCTFVSFFSFTFFYFLFLNGQTFQFYFCFIFSTLCDYAVPLTSFSNYFLLARYLLFFLLFILFYSPREKKKTKSMRE